MIRSRIALAAVLTFAFVGCSAPATPALNTIDPVAFQSAVENAANKLQVPGALVLLQTPQGTFTAKVGTTELGKKTPPQPDTHFRIASNTKTMTAALILLLAQDGKLTLDDPISAYVRHVPNGEAITLADLLTMRSGLYCYTFAPELSAQLDADPAKPWTPAQVLAIAFAQPPTAAPDTAYEYCNTNYALLGLVAEKVGGSPLAEQFSRRLFEPLGMRATTLPAADDTALPNPYSHGYMYGKTLYALVDENYPADLAAAARAGTVQPIDYTHQNSSYATAAGGAISTAQDLATWIRALGTGAVFDDGFTQRWRESLRPEDPAHPDGQQYGYGISYQRFGSNAAMYYHGGEMPGFNSYMGYDPDHDVTLVIWTNLTLSPEGKTTANALLPTVLDEIYPGLNLS
ncbi:D-alanyl-D-alanine carboxypeptidase [Mycobacterium frederiksbergense]|uniref:D-alanyl-D-alanine carboxypeptidase n=1 Tax=Mycolicibacterium frederiksbergense TaxID=117567 RepID=A0ABT6KVZ6_9MYCO|nr:serine hydrolase domain-containing protein [Mycolicibacterium frederiksbergense]MDH6194887.1 D-alanyl-D-alanine carboxypeptidase [Mycolicibacterium frederiksbergense]